MWNDRIERRVALKLVTGAVAAASGLTANRDVKADVPRVLPADRLPNDKRLGDLKDLNGDFSWQPSETYEEWQQRAEYVRRQILVALGLWPMPDKTPLSPVIHGKVDRDDYTIEKVIIESFPGLYLTGSLYRPKGKEGKRPGILCPHGHWPTGRYHDHGAEKVKLELESKAEHSEIGGRHPLQARCVELARLGCVVFIYDMLGYGDNHILSHELTHRFAKQRPEMSQTDRWGLFSAQAELRLINVMGMQTWNSIRAVDFLSALPDVDAQNLGVTGASGGGTQTFILAAVDPRPKAFFPAVMVSTKMQGGCTCENASLLRVNTGNIEFAALAAPRALGMTGANDWTNEIETKGFPQLVEHFVRVGAPGKVAAKYFPFEHNYNHPSRMMMYDFFNEHLHLGADEIVERDFVPLTKEEISVWDAEHPMPKSDDEAELKVVRAFATAGEKKITELANDQEKLGTLLAGAWDILIGRRLPEKNAISHDVLGEAERNGFKEYRVLLQHKSRGEEIPALILLPADWNKEVTIWLTDEGKSGLFDKSGKPIVSVQTLLDSKQAVIGLDLLYQGEFLQDGESLKETRRVNGNPREFLGYTVGYNHPLFSQRVHDVLSAIAFVRDHETEPKAIHLAGFGAVGLYAAAAAAQAGCAVKKLAVGTNGYRFATITDIRDPMLLPGAVKYGDVPGLLTLTAANSVFIAGEKAGKSAPVIKNCNDDKPKKNMIYVGKAVDAPAAAANWLVEAD